MERDEAGENLRKAMEIFESALRSHGRWKKGVVEKLEGMVDLLIKDKDGRTAAINGHGATAKLLLGTGKVDLDAKDEGGRTPYCGRLRTGMRRSSRCYKLHKRSKRAAMQFGRVQRIQLPGMA
ncbi:unnamed protein product [Fusarium fujikuroi]|uniref:Uncharacterized protein n=1 Tax=Fusarium fujikuroi TaxID=5127 RepID=A0A9Q9RE66_FUSFU|nr:unnamed protein product [Fusarium fujikuroi]VTT59409.1 unnamed protein product [Fusarium fujikuroi]